MAQKILVENLSIYTNEIINKEEFLKIYNEENVLGKFDTIITTSSHHPFATFLSKPKKNMQAKIGNIIILRAVKENNKFEFATKIQKWGKFSIPKEAIEILNVNNHEKILFEVAKESEKSNENDKRYIDLSKIKEHKAIYRNNNFITLFKEARTPITLPRFIEITPELIELFFLIHGDGSYKEKLFFVNKNPELHKFVIEQFEKILKVPKEIWKIRVLFNCDSNPELAKLFWKNELNLDRKQFYPTISKTTLNTSEKGNLRIVIEMPIVADLFRYIFEQLQNQRDKMALHSLNGLLCAEGGARKNKRGLHKITLSFSKKEKEMFENILKNAEVYRLCKIEQNSRFCISKWENLYFFFKLFFYNNITPFNIHTQRCKNALEGFLNHGFTKTLIKYLNVINEKEYFTIKELAEEMDCFPNSILNTLRKKQYSTFVKIEGKGINRNPYVISITSEGKEFIMLIKQMQEAYNEKCRLGQDKEREKHYRIA